MTTTHEAPAPDVDEHPFESTSDPRWALSLEQVMAVAIFGVMFLMLCYVPLRASDLWCHVAYGQWILDHRQLPTEDPVMPLARGMQVIDTAWLSQVLLGAVDRYLGPAAISQLFAITGLVAYLIWARVFYLQSQRVWLSVLATLLLLLVGWSRLMTVRPETFAMVCCAMLFLFIARQQLAGASDSSASPRRDWLTWIGVPLVFVLWANLHGSFVIGLVVLGCFVVGQGIEVWWQSRSVKAVLADRPTRRWLYLAELALLATLVNPYGIDLWIHTVRFSANPNLRGISEWQPLVIFAAGGRQFAISMLLLVVVWRHSRRRIQPVEVLLLLVFAAAAVQGVRMIGWYAPAFMFVLTPHLAEIAQRLWPARESPLDSDAADGVDESAATAAKVPLPGHSFRYSLVALLVVWIIFAFSPLSGFLFPQRAARTPKQLYGAATPVALTRYLSDPPEDSPLARKEQWNKLVFHPQEWGDWLDREGPPAFKPFVTTNMHLVPPQVWGDYLRVMAMQSGWEKTLDRYAVGTIIVDKEQQAPFFSLLNREADWQNVYEDEQAAVFVRRGRSAAELSVAAPQREETL